MIRKQSPLGESLYTGTLVIVSLVGICGCTSQAPNAPQPTQAPQAPVAYPVTQPAQPTQPNVDTAPQMPSAQMTWIIQGRKFLDQDGNRQFSTQDKGVSGWDIRLYPGSVMQTNTWSTPMASTTTDANGTFSFSGLGSGTYIVVSAPQGNNGEKLQQVTPTNTSYAKSITLPQAANGYCQPTAYQVTVDNTCPQTCDLQFIDQGTYAGGYPGMGYGGAYGGMYPYGGAGCGYPYGGLGYGYYPYDYAFTYPSVIPILVIDSPWYYNTPCYDYECRDNNCDRHHRDRDND